MNESAGRFVCHGCAAVVDAATALPFRCPNAGQDDVDHLLLPADAPDPGPLAGDDPFRRYRRLLAPYRLARRLGLSDSTWDEITGRLDAALQAIDGSGFRITPTATAPELAAAIGHHGELWVKDETRNVSGSHKARHLMGVMLYLQVLRTARAPLADSLAERRLAIASCGNAALAAAVIARAADWPLDVFIPPDAAQAVRRRLADLGARISVCERLAGERGDPCFLRFREAVLAGALPFGVQGPENGLAIEGGRTLAFEMAEAFAASPHPATTVFVQVGGGALASALAQGFALAERAGLLAQTPRLVAVQAAACAPLARAWTQMAGTPPQAAAQTRSRYMWAWETTPHSVAHGILDDETYDWLEIVSALQRNSGEVRVVDEEALARAETLARQHTGITASATGSAGLAGITAGGTDALAVILSGIAR